MIRSGKQIDAVHFIHAFQLTESFPPVPLLKTYLKELRRNSQGDSTGDAQVDLSRANDQMFCSNILLMISICFEM